MWIAPIANAHLQATGVDAAGRKQYRYHHEWTRYCNETKCFRLLEFGSKLPEFRMNIQKDLRRKELDEIQLTDRNLAKLVKKCQDIPGQELYQYYIPGGERRSIDSGQVNNYIRRSAAVILPLKISVHGRVRCRL